MQEIMQWLDIEVNRVKAKDIIQFEVISPDIQNATYSGSSILINNKKYIYRSFKSWVELASLYFCKILTPKVSLDNMIIISYQKLDLNSSFHHNKTENKDEKYGVESSFFEIQKIEEPSFIYYYNQALKNVNIYNRKRVINLGVNRADEFEVIESMLSKEQFRDIDLVGVDYSHTAINYAKNRFKSKKFYQYDINKLDDLNLGKFDLLITIGTLQSVNSNFKLLFISLVQNLLDSNSALIMGFPNSRWIDKEMIYGAKAPNYSYSELSILYKDVYFCKKYLQQHKYRVTITGKDYIFLTATKIYNWILELLCSVETEPTLDVLFYYVRLKPNLPKIFVGSCFSRTNKLVFFYALLFTCKSKVVVLFPQSGLVILISILL